MDDVEWTSDDVEICSGGTLVTEEYDQLVTSASTAVIEALASVEEVDPVGLSTPEGITLHDYVDPDALDRLFANGGATNISIIFLVDEYRVRITHNEVAIADREPNPTGPSETAR